MTAIDEIYDPTDPATIADPYPALARLCAEAPVAWSGRLKAWLLTRYDDCLAAQRDRRFSAERMVTYFQGLAPARREQLQRSEGALGRWAVFLDPPGHTRIRAHLNGRFTTAALSAMAPRIAHRIDVLLAPAREGRRMDFIADFAYPLPASVIMDILGAPLGCLDEVQRWSHDLALFVGSSQTAPNKHLRAEAAVAGLDEIFRDLLRARRRRPADDLVSELAASTGLSDDDLVANCILLLFAGHETTTGLLANGLMRLVQHPRQQDLLRREPARAEAAVEEMLRYDSPAPAVSRIAAEDIEIRGQRIPAGARVFLMLNAANRDPEAFEDPERFDIARREGRQIAFGFGIHFCVGAPLARLEAALAFPRLLAAMREIEITADRLDWRDGVSLRGAVSMPIRFRPAELP
ncbi:MAG: cytochrome P450 [Alphaproteobacteria bacterium]|nr:cytochrome P450 [Alphaproteobacteria bacterium]